MLSKSLLVGLISGVFAACGGRATPEQRSAHAMVAPVTVTVAAPPGAPGSAAMLPPETPGAPRPTKVAAEEEAESNPGLSTDQQIAAVRNALHDGQIEQAGLAERKAASYRVRDFATGLAAEHAAAKERQAELLDRLRMTAVENKQSVAVRAEAHETLETLKATDGIAFDEAFLDAEVDQQNKMLDLVRNQLIPHTENSDLRADLVRLVPSCISAVDEVLEIRRDLAANPASANDNHSFSQRVWQ